MRFFLRLLILSFSIILISCQPLRTPVQRSSGDLETYDLGEAYRLNSCMVRFDEGEEAPRALPSTQRVTTHFQKIFDQSRLRAVAKASARSVADFARLDGAEVYHVPLTLPGACNGLSALPEAPADFVDYWSEIASPGAIGVYLPLNRAKPHGANRPVIIVRSDTDRYTMVHEYLHHVFNEIRESQGQRDEDLMARLETFSLRYDEVGPLPARDEGSVAKVRTYLEAWTQLHETLIEVLKVFPLEEMTVEALLQDSVRRGDFAPITNYNRVNSVAYIRKSFDQSAQEHLERIRGIASANLKLARRHNLTEWAERSEKLLFEAQKDLAEGARLRAEYASETFGFQISRHLSEDSVEHPETECSHVRSFKEELKKRGIKIPAL